MSISSSGGFSNTNIYSLPSHEEIVAKRPDDSWNYVETLVEKNLIEVKFEDRPKLYRHTVDEYGDVYKFYNGITNDHYESFVRKIIDSLGAHEKYGNNGLKLSVVIQKIDKSGMSYDNDYVFLSRVLYDNKVAREKKKSEILDKKEKHMLEIGSVKYNILMDKMGDMVSPNISSSVNNSMVSNSNNINNRNTKIDSTVNNNRSINKDNNNSNNITIVIENVNLHIDSNRLNNSYMKDKEYNLQVFLDYFPTMDKSDQVKLMDHLQKVISYSPNLENCELYTNEGKSGPKKKDDLSFLPKLNEDTSLKNYILDHKIRFVEPKNLENAKLNKTQKKNLLDELIKIGACQNKIINLDNGQENNFDLTVCSSIDVRRMYFEEIIDKYMDSCKIRLDSNEKVINLKTLYAIADNNSYIKKVFDFILEEDTSKCASGMLTKKINGLIDYKESKYYIKYDEKGARINSAAKEPILFIR